MKPTAAGFLRKRFYAGAFLTLVLLIFPVLARSADYNFNVTSPGFFFSFNGTNTTLSFPTLTLMRGKTYTFTLNTTPNFHPFAIGTSVFGGAPTGVSGANGQTSGVITFAVPLDAQDCVYYCAFHGFNGNIVMVDPPAPPSINIVGLNVSTNLTVTSTITATNGLTITPEFNTNLFTTNWTALTVKSNRFFNGTNEITCGRPEAAAVFLRIRAQQQ